MDADELRLEITIVTQDALDLADKLAEMVSVSPRSDWKIARAAGDFKRKRADLRRLRAALRIEVAG